MSTFWRYLKIQAFVLVCGIVGPLFLAVYFMTGSDPTMKWMFWWWLRIRMMRRSVLAGQF